MIQKEDFFTRKKKEIGVSLNEVQKKAVLHTEGPLLLLASPGSGKTTTTIMRIGYLIEEMGINPKKIKAVTFSRVAATDMKERYKRLFSTHEKNSVDFSTIHSLAFEVVRDYFKKIRVPYQLIEGKADGNSSKLNIQKRSILMNLFKDINGEKITEDELDDLSTYITYIKNKLIPQSNWSKVKCNVPQAIEILKRYEVLKRENPEKLLLDYDDMLTVANIAFDEDSEILKKYQERYDYFLTDESQDSSRVQHSIIEKLVNHHQNLFVVADDDQSIYSWRGAEPQYLLDFRRYILML